MKLLVDENLPLEILDHLPGHVNGYHVNQLKSVPRQKITDDQLRKYSMKHGCIIMTKDDDFVRSWVSRKVPDKLIFIHLDARKTALLSFLIPQLKLLCGLVADFDFIELTEKGIRLPFENRIPYK